MEISLDFSPGPVPSALISRLATPPQSPTKHNLRLREEAAEKIRALHLLSVKDKARRELERAEEAQARKCRLVLDAASKIVKRAELADLKLANLRAAEERRREEARQKRVAYAEAVAAKRQAAEEEKERRAASLLKACSGAESRRSRMIEETVERSAAEVKHALSVVEAQKEKERSALLEAGERLNDRLHAAETRRELAKDKKSPSSPGTGKGGVRHRVLNEASVAAGLKRRSLTLAMERAATNRENHVQGVALKASSHVRAVREKAAAVADRDAAAHKRTAYARRMVSAEIARLTELKKRYGALGRSDTCPTLVLVGDLTHAAASPPPALLRRLVASPKTLLATAAARQAGAAARRSAIATKRAAAVAQRMIKAVSVARRRAITQAHKQSTIDSRATRSAGTLALRAAERSRLIKLRHVRVQAAAERRATADRANAAKAVLAASRTSAAAERASFRIRCRAKTGLIALQAAACANRRASAASALGDRSAAHAARCTDASARLRMIMAARVAKAFASSKKAPASTDASATALDGWMAHKDGGYVREGVMLA